MDLQLHPLARAYLAGGDGVTAGLEADQAVFADPPQMLLGHQIRPRRQRCRSAARSASARTAMTWPWVRWT